VSVEFESQNGVRIIMFNTRQLSSKTLGNTDPEGSSFSHGAIVY